MNHRVLPILFKRLIVGLFAGLLVGGEAIAQTPAYAYAPSTVVADSIPLGNASYDVGQFLFTPSNFAPAVPSSGGIIKKIYVRAGNTQASGSVFSSLSISMGATSLSSLTAGVWNSGLTPVYTNPSASLSAWNTNDWIPITLQVPFTWNGSSSFIISLYQNGYTNPLKLQRGTVSGVNTRVYGQGSSGAPSGTDSALISFGFDLDCDGTPSIPGITSSPLPAANPLCSGSTTTINASYPSTPVIAGITYKWESSASASGPWSPVTGGSGATTLSYTTGALAASTYFRIGATCSNSSITSYSTPFFVEVGSPQPAAISGPVYCPGDPVSFTVPNVSGTSYTWTLPSGWSGSSTTNTILVTPGTTGGVISVTATSSCGPASIARNYTPVMSSAPSTPGSVFGNTLVCAGTSQTYNTLPVSGATSYIWTLPSGWTGTSTTNSITVTTSTTSGGVTVKAVNGCGQSLNSNPLLVTIISSIASPGTITGQDTTCSTGQYSYSINPVPGASSYSWTLPSGWSGTTAGTSIQVFAGSLSGTISVTAHSACATSTSSSKVLTAITTVVPSVTLATPPSSFFCERTPVTFTATGVNGGSAPSYQWKKNGVNVAGAGNSYTDNTLASTDYISVVMSSNAVCKSTATATSNPVSVNITPSVTPGVSINTVPPITICKGTAVTFTTTSVGTGATPAYQWFKNGSAILSATGTSYTDPLLMNADTLTIQMTSTAPCATSAIAVSNKVGVRVDEPLIPSVSINVSPSNILIPGQPVTFTATQSNGGARPDFQWQKNGVNIPFENGDMYTTSSLKVGDNISVRMLSYADCVAPGLVTSNIIAMRSPLNVAVTGQEQRGISIYPNPNSGRFTLAAASWEANSGKQVRVEVLNGLGQSVYHLELVPTAADWKTQLSLDEQLSNGRYLLQVSTADGAYRTSLPFILNR